MSHDCHPAGAEGPSASTIVPHSPSSPYPPGRSLSTPKRTDYERQSVLSSPEDGRTERLGTLLTLAMVVGLSYQYFFAVPLNSYVFSWKGDSHRLQ